MTDNNTTETKSEKKIPWRNIGIFFSSLAMIILIAAFLYGYNELSKMNVYLAGRVTDLQEKSTRTQTDISDLQKTLVPLQQTGKEVEEIKKQQEQFLSEWHLAQKGDLNKWQVAEAQYLVKLANDHLQFTYNYKMAILLLTRADQLLANLQDETLLELRQAIAKSIVNLQSLPEIDITGLFLRLTALNVQLDHLPLPINSFKNENSKEATSSASHTSWWKTTWDNSLQALNKIVIVRKTNANALPLALPEEKAFLYQNLHAQFENAKWAVLNRNQSVYQTSLARAVVWINQHFAQDASETKAMLQNLNELLKINIQPAESNLTGPLQLFEKYFANTQTVKA